MVTAMKWPNTVAPAMMKITMHPVRRASSPDSRKPFQLSCRRAKPITRAPPAPMDPACVGLNHPRNNPPMVMKKRIMAGRIPVAARTFSVHEVAGPAGPRRGFRQQSKATVATKKRVSRAPGKMPATKSLPMDSSVKMP